MEPINVNLSCDIQQPVKVRYLDGYFFSKDSAGHRINVDVFNNGVPVSVGGSVSAEVIRSDGETVPVTGAVSENRAYVILPQAVYAVVGAVQITIKVTEGTTIVTIGCFVAYVHESDTEITVDPGTIIPSIQALISQIETAVASIPADYSSLWTSLAPAFSTSTAYAVDQYVTNSGVLYRFTTAHPAGTWNSAHVTAVNLGNDVSALKSALMKYTGNEECTNWVDNTYYKLNESSVDVLNPYTDLTHNYMSQAISCSENDAFIISGGSYGAAAKLWGFVASDGTVLKTEDTNATVSNKHITAPADTAYLVLNYYKVNNTVTVTKGIPVVQRVEDIENELDVYDIPSLKKVLCSFERATYTVETGHYYDLIAPTTKKDNGNYNAIKLAVEEGTLLLITTQVYESDSLAMLIEYDSEFNYIGYVNRGTATRTQYTDEPYVVRKGVGYITVTSVYNNPEIKEGTIVSVADRIEQDEQKISKLNEGYIFADIKNIINNGNLDSMSSWVANYGTSSLSDHVLSITGNGTESRVNCGNTTSINIGDVKYFVSVDVMVTDSECTKIRLSLAGGYRTVNIIKPVANKWYTIAASYTYNNTGTQNAFSINAYYADSATQSGKVLKVRKAIGFQTNVDFGLGINPPLYKLMNIVKMNGFWSGTKNVKIEQFSIGERINNIENNYLLPSRNAYQINRRPVITFVCDDGWQDDYDKLVAISEKHNVPFVSAIFDGSTLDEWNELYLQNELGWEFASHPENAPLAEKSTEAEIRKAMIDTNEYLTNRGLKYYNIVYPYGSNDERVRRIAKEYYRCGCTTNANINTGVVASFYLYRWPMGYGNGDNNNLAFFKGKVDEAVASNGWLIFMLHPNMSQHTAELTEIIDELIEYIKGINVDILTLNDGYNVFGNALECGDYIKSTDGIAISFDGQTANL